MAVLGSKAKALDKALEEIKGGGDGFDDVVVWPSASAHTVSSALSSLKSDLSQEEEEEQDLSSVVDYGYDVDIIEPQQSAAATKTVPQQKMPRRSSLRSNDPGYRRFRRASIGYSGEMTMVLPNKTVVKKRRSITFTTEEDTVHSILTEDDSDEDDEILSHKRQLWFQAEEYRYIERNIRNLVKTSTSTSTNTTTHTNNKVVETRGLESLMDDNTSVMERETTIQLVLDDQQRQRAMGYRDELAISAEYQYNSIDAQLVARERARQDEKDVSGYLEKTKQVVRKRLMQQRRMSC